MSPARIRRRAASRLGARPRSTTIWSSRFFMGDRRRIGRGGSGQSRKQLEVAEIIAFKVPADLPGDFVLNGKRRGEAALAAIIARPLDPSGLHVDQFAFDMDDALPPVEGPILVQVIFDQPAAQELVRANSRAKSISGISASSALASWSVNCG
jgi:hypothetical protein